MTNDRREFWGVVLSGEIRAFGGRGSTNRKTLTERKKRPQKKVGEKKDKCKGSAIGSRPHDSKKRDDEKDRERVGGWKGGEFLVGGAGQKTANKRRILKYQKVAPPGWKRRGLVEKKQGGLEG